MATIKEIASMAVGEYKAISEADLSILKDISIVGFNDQPSDMYMFFIFCRVYKY